jgi:glutathione S-transferase
MIKIYGDKKSGNCYKIQLTCALLDIKYEWIDVDIMAGECKSEAFKALNPNGKIPLLINDEGEKISESNAIINYLAFNTHLLPNTAFEFAKVQQWQFFEQYSHEPFIAVARFINKYLGLPKEREQEYRAKQEGGHKALKVMEEQLHKTRFLAGGTLTCADISLFAYTHVAAEGGFDLASYPTLQAWINRIKANEKFVSMES